MLKGVTFGLSYQRLRINPCYWPVRGKIKQAYIRKSDEHCAVEGVVTGEGLSVWLLSASTVPVVVIQWCIADIVLGYESRVLRSR